MEKNPILSGPSFEFSSLTVDGDIIMAANITGDNHPDTTRSTARPSADEDDVMVMMESQESQLVRKQ